MPFSFRIIKLNAFLTLTFRQSLVILTHVFLNNKNDVVSITCVFINSLQSSITNCQLNVLNSVNVLSLHVAFIQ